MEPTRRCLRVIRKFESESEARCWPVSSCHRVLIVGAVHSVTFAIRFPLQRHRSNGPTDRSSGRISQRLILHCTTLPSTYLMVIHLAGVASKVVSNAAGTCERARADSEAPMGPMRSVDRFDQGQGAPCPHLNAIFAFLGRSVALEVVLIHSSLLERESPDLETTLK